MEFLFKNCIYVSQSEVEKILEQQETLLTRTTNLENALSHLQTDNQKLQNLLITLLRHQGVRWDDDDKS